jgi:hypothetical protein
MLGYMCRVCESGHDLIAGEPIIFLDVLDLIAGGKSTEYCCDIDSGALDTRFAKANFRVHRYARVNFH